MKTIVRRPNPNRHPQTLESDQGFSRPPHCRASNKQTMAAIKNVAPSGSISLNFSIADLSTFVRVGFLKKSTTRKIPKAPNGRLIQKHHLHVSFSVNIPPRIGPTMDDTPNMLARVAKYMGLVFNGAAKPTMVILPENNPAAPMPAMARPMIKSADVGAMAHTTDPTVDVSHIPNAIGSILSKRTKAMTNVDFTLQNVYILPKLGWRDVVVKRYAEPYLDRLASRNNNAIISPSDIP
jgi:hypothetical protein